MNTISDSKPHSEITLLLSEGMSLPDAVEAFETAYIQAALNRNKGSHKQAAADLGIETGDDVPSCIRERVDAELNRVKRCMRAAESRPPKCDPNDPLCGL